MATVKYAVNLSETHETQLIDSTVKVPAGGWVELMTHQVGHPDIEQALKKKWIELTDKEPKKEAEPEPAALEFEKPKVHGTTVAPGKKSLKETGATSTRLGEDPGTNPGA